MWVLIFCGIAVAGVVMVACYAVWLAHKASDLFSEVTVLADRGGQMAELLGRIEVPENRLPSGDQDREAASKSAFVDVR